MQSTITPLSEEQRAAHRGAHYQAATPRSMPLRYEVHSTDLAQLMRKRFVQSAALLTAHNPGGKKQPAVKNKKASTALLARIEALGLAWLPGYRKAFKEGEPDEDGYLVFGISGGQLEALMVEFDQEVALWCPSTGTPVLMLHPLARRNYSAAEMAFERALREAAKSEAKPAGAPKNKTAAPTTAKAPSTKPAKHAEALPAAPAPIVVPPAAPSAPATAPATKGARPRAKAQAPAGTGQASVAQLVTGPADVPAAVDPVVVKTPRSRAKSAPASTTPVAAVPAPAPAPAELPAAKPSRRAGTVKV